MASRNVSFSNNKCKRRKPIEICPKYRAMELSLQLSLCQRVFKDCGFISEMVSLTMLPLSFASDISQHASVRKDKHAAFSEEKKAHKEKLQLLTIHPVSSDYSGVFTVLFTL